MRNAPYPGLLASVAMAALSADTGAGGGGDDPKPPAPKPQAAPAPPAAEAPAAPPPPISLADIEAQVATEVAVEFEPLLPNGQPSGVVLLILSDQAPSVQAGIRAILDDQRRADQMRGAQSVKARPGHEPIESIEEVAGRNRALVALRIQGWTRGLTDPVTQENKIRLLRLTKWGDQILEKSAELGDFKPASATS